MRMKRTVLFAALIILVGAGCAPAQKKQVETPVGSEAPVQVSVIDSDAWKLALAKVGECDAKSESEAAVPDSKTLQDLGLQGLLDEGFTVSKICNDGMSGRVAVILAKQDLTSPAEGIAPTCVDRCDSVVFATIDTSTGALNQKKSTKKLGIFSEAYDQRCLVDQVVPATEQANDKILFYCGSGESGGLVTWYQYEFNSDTLTTVQIMTDLEPEKFDVKSPSLLPSFRYKSNADIR